MKPLNPNISGLKLLFITSVFLLFRSILSAQPTLPQKIITVTATQPLHFGTFALAGIGGGTVTVGYDGSRMATGAIFLSPLAPSAQPAIFDIKLCQGRNVTITFAPGTILTGSNGGTLTLDIGPTEKGTNGAKFEVDTNCNFITTLRVGGTLHIPGNSQPGIYTGNFEIIFEQE